MFLVSFPFDFILLSFFMCRRESSLSGKKAFSSSARVSFFFKKIFLLYGFLLHLLLSLPLFFFFVSPTLLDTWRCVSCALLKPNLLRQLQSFSVISASSFV